ncbi:hypothetical protein [Mucilaginibacter arboris]|uniref:Uncharacterized protein n=1 Tax=Mucilaginibacter arboris TaxID=2682090 RepID=A0A7K1SRU4_9SPHI|nr:hypothetical protein [Mucilaginibacter arboris]MVN20035.1 hypothetical protein [Mucilaginibacter arboris]
MKKFINNTNPFILLLAPVIFALLLGINYEVGHLRTFEITSPETVSLFSGKMNLFQTVCEVVKEQVW